MVESRGNVVLGIEYDGSGFKGFQYQPGKRTVQGSLERALSKIANEPVHVVAAGRTDTGVHATHQVVSFPNMVDRPVVAWHRGVNTYLPHDIAVVWSKIEDPCFHARFTACWRRYMYVFGESETIPAIGTSMAAWYRNKLNERLMHDTAQILAGELDFSSFQAAQCQSSTAMRCVHKISVKRASNFVVLDLTANAFLLRMVRNIAGTLLAVSRGKLNKQEVKEILKSKDRNLTPPTAPASGLYLVQVGYASRYIQPKLRIPPIVGCDLCHHKYERNSF